MLCCLLPHDKEKKASVGMQFLFFLSFLHISVPLFFYLPAIIPFSLLFYVSFSLKKNNFFAASEIHCCCYLAIPECLPLTFLQNKSSQFISLVHFSNAECARNTQKKRKKVKHFTLENNLHLLSLKFLQRYSLFKNTFSSIFFSFLLNQ